MIKSKKKKFPFLQIYLSIIFFSFTFFTAYAFRYDVLGMIYPDKSEAFKIPDEALSQLETRFKKLTLPTSQNIDIIREILKETVPGYSFIIYRTDSVEYTYKDTIESEQASGKFFFTVQGGSSNKHNYQYAKSYQIKMAYTTIELTLHPLFSEYLMLYQLIDALLSLLLTICFYFYLTKKESKRKFRPWLRKQFKNLSFKAAHKLFYQLMVLNVVAGVVAVSVFIFMYTNRYAFFDFVQDVGYRDYNFDQYAKKIINESTNMKLNKENKAKFAKLIEPNIDSFEAYLFNREGIYYLGSNNAQSIYDNFYRNNMYDVSSITTPIMYQYTLPYDGGYGSILIYSYPLVVFVTPYMTIIILVSLSLYIISLLKFIRKKVQYIHQMQEDVSVLSSGDWQHSIIEKGNDEIAVLGKHLNSMRISFIDNIEKENEARFANKELIAAMSHDLRTPLTSLNGYLEILSLQKGDATMYQEYLQRSLDKVEEIKDLSNKMLSYALVYGKEEGTDLNVLKYDEWQTILKENIDFITLKGYHVICTMNISNDCTIYGNIQLFKRICNNVFTNIYKYGEKNKDVQVTCKIHETNVEMTMLNVKCKELDQVESNSIGLKSVKRMMEIQKGKYFILNEGDVFSIVLSFQNQEAS